MEFYYTASERPPDLLTTGADSFKRVLGSSVALNFQVPHLSKDIRIDRATAQN